MPLHPDSQLLAVANQTLLNHVGCSASELVKLHPPRFQNSNKQLVYNLVCPKGADSHHGKLEYTRWRQLELPIRVTACGSSGGLQAPTFVEGFYTYPPPPADVRESHWHINFADSSVFGFYGSSLFAQDELQCLEHPALCALRECLDQIQIPDNRPLFNPRRTKVLISDALIATPILVSGVERRAHIRTDINAREGRPKGLYGRNFAHASPPAVQRATTPLDVRLDAAGNPYFSNIIAIAAPRGGGLYRESTIRHILATAYTAFVAASTEALVNAGFLIRRHDGNRSRSESSSHIVLADPVPSGEVRRVVVHTGNWGCGAFGGNPLVMAMLQILAGHMAQVDLVYYVRDAANKRECEQGLHDLKEILGGLATDGEISLNAVIGGIVKKQYKWGISNGT